jgi:hypothetical protein
MSNSQSPLFVTKFIFDAVQNKDFDLTKTAALINNIRYGVYSVEDIKKSPISIRSLCEQAYLNAVCSTLFEKLSGNIPSKYTSTGFKDLLTVEVEQDCKRNIAALLTTEAVSSSFFDSNPETGANQYYELQGTQDGLLTVVVKNEFLNHLVESKDNYLQFVLKCLEFVYNRSQTVTDRIVNRLLSAYLYYRSGQTFDAAFRAKMLAQLY